MIVAHRLSKSFGDIVAVDSVDFHIPRGEVVGFLGPNGAGKTTTIRMLTGFLRPTSGSATVDGVDVVRRSLAVRRRIGYLPESAPLYGEMRVREYLLLRCRLYGVPRGRRPAAIDRVLAECSLEPVARRPIGQLSKGYRQRVGLAAALLHEPPLIILDEPMVGLDPGQIRDVRALIRRLAGEHTVLFSSHILAEVELVCDRLVLITAGRVRAAGTLLELGQLDRRGSVCVVETTSSKAADLISGLEEVLEVQTQALEGPWKRLTVVMRPGGGDPRERIADLLRSEGEPIRELHMRRRSLEHLFFSLTAAVQPDPPDDGAEPTGGGSAGRAA